MKKKSIFKKQQTEEKKLTSLVREIIGGRTLIDIPLSLLPKIRDELELSRIRAKKEGSITRLERIQAVLCEIDRIEKRKRSNKKNQENFKSSSNLNIKSNSSFISEKNDIPIAVIDSVLDDLIDGIPFDVAETPMIPLLITRAKERIDKLLAEGELINAQKLENIHVRLVSLKEERNSEAIKDDKITSLLKFIEDNNNKIEELLLAKQESLDNHDKSIQDMINAKQQEFDKINTEYDTETYGPLPATARKLSSQCLNVREQERFLIQSRRYEEAAAMRAEADELERQDLETCRNEFIRRREQAKKVEIGRQQHRLQCIIDNGNRTRLKIESEYNKQIEELKKSIENTESRIKRIDSSVLNTVSIISTNHNSSNSQNITKPTIKDKNKTKPSSVLTKRNNNIKADIKDKQNTTFVTQASPRIIALSRPKTQGSKPVSKIQRAPSAASKPKRTDEKIVRRCPSNIIHEKKARY